MAIKYTLFSIKTGLKTFPIPFVWLLAFVFALIPQIPVTFIMYISIMAILIENSTHIRFPYRFILPITNAEAVNGRFIYSLLLAFLQLMLYGVSNLVNGIPFVTEFTLFSVTAVNCFALIIAFFYTNKRKRISLVLTGIVYALALQANTFYWAIGGDLNLGALIALIICAIVWTASYILAHVLAAKQFAQ